MFTLQYMMYTVYTVLRFPHTPCHIKSFSKTIGLHLNGLILDNIGNYGSDINEILIVITDRTRSTSSQTMT